MTAVDLVSWRTASSDAVGDSVTGLAATNDAVGAVARPCALRILSRPVDEVAVQFDKGVKVPPWLGGLG